MQHGDACQGPDAIQHIDRPGIAHRRFAAAEVSEEDLHVIRIPLAIGSREKLGVEGREIRFELLGPHPG